MSLRAKEVHENSILFLRIYLLVSTFCTTWRAYHPLSFLAGGHELNATYRLYFSTLYVYLHLHPDPHSTVVDISDCYIKVVL